VLSAGRWVLARLDRVGDPARSSDPAAADAPPPIKVLDVELASALPAFGPSAYESGLALVRLHGHPVGVVDLPLGAEGLSANACARRIWSELSGEMMRHLAADGLPTPPGLPPHGLGAPGALPGCIVRRRALRAATEPASVVIATRERPDALARCLRSLRELDHPDFEVIVVDNAPTTEATRDLVLRDHPEVHYVREDRRGLAAAHNRGLREATGALIAFTDDDVTVDRLWLLALAAGFADAGVACVTGLIVPAELDTPAQVWADRHWGLAKGFREELFSGPLRRMSASPYPYAAGTFGSGANMAFRTSALREMGGFDPSLGAGTPAYGGDDLAAFFDVIAAGHAIRYTPAAIIRHWYARDVDALRRQAFGYGAGLTAYLAKVLADRPSRVVDLAARAPRGLTHAQALAQGRRAGDGHPPELVRLERRGMLRGAAGYLTSRRRGPAGLRA
jgi:GT2 family glycosyltransferase